MQDFYIYINLPEILANFEVKYKSMLILFLDAWSQIGRRRRLLQSNISDGKTWRSKWVKHITE